jgi:hypothetical protein
MGVWNSMRMLYSISFPTKSYPNYEVAKQACEWKQAWIILALAVSDDENLEVLKGVALRGHETVMRNELLLVLKGWAGILDAFAKLRQSSISFVTSVRLSRRNNSAPTGQFLMKFDVRVYLEKSLEKIQVSLKSGKNNL